MSDEKKLVEYKVMKKLGKAVNEQLDDDAKMPLVGDTKETLARNLKDALAIVDITKIPAELQEASKLMKDCDPAEYVAAPAKPAKVVKTPSDVSIDDLKAVALDMNEVLGFTENPIDITQDYEALKADIAGCVEEINPADTFTAATKTTLKTLGIAPEFWGKSLRIRVDKPKKEKAPREQGFSRNMAMAQAIHEGLRTAKELATRGNAIWAENNPDKMAKKTVMTRDGSEGLKEQALVTSTRIGFMEAMGWAKVENGVLSFTEGLPI